MNRDSEDIQRRILGILQDLLPTASLSDADAVSQLLKRDTIETVAPGNLPLSPEGALPVPPPSGSSFTPLKKDPVFELGDVPAVQERFHALLKHRLQSEIEKNLPLFPWETEVSDYQTDGVYGATETRVESASSPGVQSPSWIWNRQLSGIQLPVKVPTAILSQLLQRCQEAAQLSLREGAKLVKAVDTLFPEQSEALNYLAGLVIASPARSGTATVESPTGSNFPHSYETAVPAQQMILSLLAAREIMNHLTLTISASQPLSERQWETEQGVITLQAHYDDRANPASVRIQATLPTGGSLVLQSGELQAIAHRPVAGYLSVELFEPQVDQSYPLEVRLAESEQAPLTFVIQVVEP